MPRSYKDENKGKPFRAETIRERGKDRDRQTNRQRGRNREREEEKRKRNNQKLALIVNQLR